MVQMEQVGTASPKARRARWPWALLCVGSTWAVPALAETWINVSEAATGTAEPLPPLIAKSACGSRCRSAFVAVVSRDGGYAQQPLPAFVSRWPAVYTPGSATLEGIAVQAAVPAPAAPYTGFDIQSYSVERRASVSFNTDPWGAAVANGLVVQTWATGSGTAVMSYGARVQPGTQARKAYLSLAVPTIGASAFTARKITGGTLQRTWPTRAFSRVAMDVYVNGLPVWNREQAVLFPERAGNANGTPMNLSWGPEPAGDRIRLFLGTLPAGSQHQVAVIFRADSRALAGTCEMYASAGETLQSCHTQRMSLSLPSVRQDDGDLLAPVQMRPDIVVELQP